MDQVRRLGRAVGLVIAVSVPSAGILIALVATWSLFAQARPWGPPEMWSIAGVLMAQGLALWGALTLALLVASGALLAMGFGLAMHDLASMPMHRHSRTSRRLVAWTFPVAALFAAPLVTLALVPALFVLGSMHLDSATPTHRLGRLVRSALFQVGWVLVGLALWIMPWLALWGWTATAALLVPGSLFAAAVWIASYTSGSTPCTARFRSHAWPLAAQGVRGNVTAQVRFLFRATVLGLPLAVVAGLLDPLLLYWAPLLVIGLLILTYLPVQALYGPVRISRWMEARQTDQDYWAARIHVAERYPPFLLFLRSHSVEHSARYATPADVSTWFVERSCSQALLAERGVATRLTLAEFVQALSEIPVICLGVPENAAERPFGVPAEVRVDAQGWEEHVKKLMEHAAVIVAVTGSTAGIQYEVDLLLRHFAEKSLILGPLEGSAAFEVIASPGPHLQADDRLENTEPSFHRIGAQVFAISDSALS